MPTRDTCAAAARRTFLTAVLVAGAAGITEAQTPRKPAGTLILGEVTSLAVRDMNDPASGGRIVVDGRQITIPEKLLIGLPSGQKSLRDLMLDAPAECKSQQPPQSGLAASDSCRGDRLPALARVVASASASGELVASVVMILKDSGPTLSRFRRQHETRVRPYGQQPSEAGAHPKPPGTQPR
jgi:hypothetical protein